MAPKKGKLSSPPTKKGGKGVSKESKRAKRAKKDKNAPKRAKSSYLCFTMENRQAVIEKDPSLAKNVVKVTSILGAQWKKLSDPQKIPYQKLANEDKKRYEKEMDAYRKKM
eukprot:GHVS01085805.1.p2 GENE.GHVS01085805.1~~GHVS01085805.1.p2  ORF type:complete len:111 (+),score=23.08 GHVS01085805.1:293-625(+)